MRDDGERDVLVALQDVAALVLACGEGLHSTREQTEQAAALGE